MLSELRKYRVNMILSHQYLSQLDPQVRDAILGNTGTIISFRLGLTDAEMLAGEFYPFFSARDLINLPNYHIYLRLIIEAVVSQPFSGETIMYDLLRKQPAASGQPYSLISKIAGNNQCYPAYPVRRRPRPDSDFPTIHDPKEMKQSDCDKNGPLLVCYY